MDTRERIQGYLREDMRTVSNEKKSAMPVFGTDRLSDADLDDLLAYLESLQGTAPAPSNAR
jgi:mono/diheme cytochrome c family protein